jgi:hypothetical protein
MEPNTVVIIVTKLWTALAEESWFNPQQRFLFFKKHLHWLKCPLSFIQWVPGAFAQGIKWLRHKLITHLHLVLMCKISDAVSPLHCMSAWYALRLLQVLSIYPA